MKGSESSTHSSLVIIGAGICGLAVANKVANTVASSIAALKPLVLDKGRGVGGRLATRRAGDRTFDHGAQFYRRTPDVESLHTQWVAEGIVSSWFQTERGEHFCATKGMSSLAKALARGANVELEARVTALSVEGTKWKVSIDGRSEPLLASGVVLTAPLPQALQLLEESAIEYQSELRQVKYAKALVGLFEYEGNVDWGHRGYWEPNEHGIQSLADQRTKGLSRLSATTMTMDPAWSEKMFDVPEDEVLKEMENVFTLQTGITPVGQQLKKWRYAQPLATANSLFRVVSEVPPLILAGDGFGGASVSGALRSAEAAAMEVQRLLR